MATAFSRKLWTPRSKVRANLRILPPTTEARRAFPSSRLGEAGRLEFLAHNSVFHSRFANLTLRHQILIRSKIPCENGA
jgi:hypothetical protein